MFKNKFLTIALIITVHVSWAQPWTENLPQNKTRKDLTLFDYKKAFNDYWEPYQVHRGYYVKNGEKVKASGWKQFMRWYYHMEGQVNPSTGEFPNRTAQEVYNEYLKNHPQAAAPKNANWLVLGPNSSSGGYNGIGRINCIEFHPSNNNIYWVGAASGGIWATTNNGVNWIPLSDFNSVLGISSIVVSPDYETSNTIYIASGDKDGGDNNSTGIYKSTDGGQTWNPTDINYDISLGYYIYSILMDPNNYQTLICSTTNGVFKTSDGGQNWAEQLSATEFVDMKYKPGDFNTLYGATGGGKIFYSINGGQDWTESLSTGGRRVHLAVSVNQPEWVYAVVAASNKGLLGIYKSTDSGQSFSQVFNGTETNHNLLGWSSTGSDSGGQGIYDLAIAVSPDNANTLLVGGINTWRSTNGGTSWTLVNYWTYSSGKPTVHADKHMLRYRSNGDLFETNDGGVYLSANNGTSWSDKTNSMVISQMYKLSVATTSGLEVINGLQDNGTKLFYNNAWDDVKGGDGCECLIDYSNALIQYGSYVYGQISRTNNRWSSTVDIEPSGAGDGAWVTPFIIDPVNPATLYAGYADVWKTTNRGNSWTKISNINSSDKIRSMAVAPSNNQVIYVADLTRIWKTTNGGTSWSNVTASLPSGSANINYISVKNDDPQTVWVALGGYNGHGVYQSVNGGGYWTNISDGLPEIPMYSVVQNKQVTAQNHLYVGSELGVYFKKGTDDWILYNTNLPNVKIGELEIFYATDPTQSKLIAATYGRGAWKSPVYYNTSPMAFVSCSASQPDTSGVRPGIQNVLIMKMEIETDGILNPLSLSDINVSMAGTSNVSDVDSVKIFYTGTNPVFEMSNQYGTSQASSQGGISFNQNLVLNAGINNFWMVYNLKQDATVGNILNAGFISISIAGQNYSPAIVSPGNGRIIIDFPALAISTDTLSFGNVLFNTFSEIKSYTISGTNLQNYISINAPSGFKISKALDGTYSSFTSVYPENGSVNTSIFVKFNPTTIQEYNGFINHSSTGASQVKLVVSGVGSETSAVSQNDEIPEPITVSPNPSSNVFYINNLSCGQMEVEITDLKGRLIERKTISGNSKSLVDFTNLPGGVYFLKYQSRRGVHTLRLLHE